VADEFAHGKSTEMTHLAGAGNVPEQAALPVVEIGKDFQKPSINASDYLAPAVPTLSVAIYKDGQRKAAPPGHQGGRRLVQTRKPVIPNLLRSPEERPSVNF